MSDSDEKQMPSNSSDISIEEIGPESEGHAVAKDEQAEVLIPPVLDDVSVGGRIEEIPAAGASAEQAEPEKVASEDEVVVITPPIVIDQGPVRRSMLVESDEESESEDEEDDDDIDETLVERLIGLSEMFPDSLRRGTRSMLGNSVSLAKWSYSNARTISWIVFSSSVTLFLPIMIETERMGIEEAQKQQQRQILLGPGAAVSAGANAPLPPMPA